MQASISFCVISHQGLITFSPLESFDIAVPSNAAAPLLIRSIKPSFALPVGVHPVTLLIASGDQ